MNRSEKRLLQIFGCLSGQQQQSLLEFAEFLATRTTGDQPLPAVPEPTPIPRPEKETVVGAIKRLSATYSMLDKPELLNETSVLMTQHVMQGRAADEVIDDLEDLFKRFYEQLLNTSNSTNNNSN